MKRITKMLSNVALFAKEILMTIGKVGIAVFYVGFALGCMKVNNGGGTWKTF